MAKSLDDMFKHENDISKIDALKICSDHLKGSWEDLSSEDFDLSVIQGGFVNRIFLCRNKVRDEKVLLRLYGGKLLEQNNILRGGGAETEVLVFHVMDQKKIGPQLLGVFPGGRLEQYIENSATLSNQDIADPVVVTAFARKLAQLHATRIPISKTPKDYLAFIDSCFTDMWDKYVDVLKAAELPPVPEMQQAAEAVYNYDFLAFITWLKEIFPKIRTRIVLSHHDMNRLNCLVKQDTTDPDQKVVLIDYEFTCYGFRGCDIGMHFKNRTIDIQEFMKGNMDGCPYPSEQERRFFATAYLEEAKRIAEDEWDDSLDNEFTLLLEAEYFGALYQLFFAAFIVKDHEKWKNMSMPIHPAVMFAGIVRDLEERRRMVMDLIQRGQLD